MSAHLSPQEQTVLISRKLAQGPSSRQFAELFAHLAECAACRDALNERRNHAMHLPMHLPMHLKDTIEWTPAHLEFEQLAGYVANKLEEVEREIADNHLAACDFCAHEVQELTGLQSDLAGVLASVHTQVGDGWWTRFKLNLPGFAFDRVWTPAFAIGMLLMFTALGSWWWRRNVAEPLSARQPIAVPSQTANPALNAAVPAVEHAKKLLAFSDRGQTIALAKDGSLNTALALPAAYHEMLAATLSQQRLKLPPVLKALTQPARTLKGGETAAPTFSVLAPAGAVLRTARPVFRWQALAGASGYTVAIFDEDFKPLQDSGTLTHTQWRAAQPLPRGRVLLWQVTAQVSAQQISAPAAPAPEARFQILAQKQAAELQRAEREFAKSHFLLGTLYAQAGLVEEAAREFQALQAENPQSAVVNKLLQQLRQPR